MSKSSKTKLQLEALRGFSSGLKIRRDLQATLDNLAEHTVMSTRAQAAVVSLVNSEQGLTAMGTHKIPGDFASYAQKLIHSPGHNPVQRVLRDLSCLRVSLDDLPQSYFSTPIPDYVRERGWDKGLIAPLYRPGEPPIGLLHGFFEVDVEPDQEEKIIHETLASLAVVAIENVLLLGKIQDQAVADERLRLGRELHDSVSQTLFSIGLGAEAAMDSLSVAKDHEAAEESISYILKLARNSLDEMKTLLFKLRPQRLDDEGLVKALSTTCQTLRERYRLRVIDDLGCEPTVSPDIKYAIFRIATEALHNCVKHSEAQEIIITLEHEDAILELKVSDNGVGFHRESVSNGHGLLTMKERATELGAKYRLDSNLGKGTQVRVEFSTNQKL